MMASGLLSRSIATFIGLTASPSAASSPPARPAGPSPPASRTASASTSTAATPASAFGRNRVAQLSPNTLISRAEGHSQTAGLSMEMKCSVSRPPVRKADQSRDMLSAVAA
jgi:hypothetical protein